jgi:ABC-type hemin transport system substrate-binding protein
MCRALRVLCAAADEERLVAVKRAAVSPNWELVGGAGSARDLAVQIREWRPDVVVLDASLGPQAVAAVRNAGGRIRLVSIGSMTGTDGMTASLENLRDAILGLPTPGGPVRG